jgi:hypothetical protein
MKKDDVQFQAVLFGDFASIQPNADTIRYFMESFSKLNLIPSVLETPEEPLRPGRVRLRIGPDIRFLFRSEDGAWTVSFRNERIDVFTAKREPDGEDLPELSDFIAQALELLEPVDKRFQAPYSRLSLVTKHFLFDADSEELTECFRTKFAEIPFYFENDPRQWNFRISSRSKVELAAAEEVNVITQMGTVTIEVNSDEDGSVKSVHGIETTFDINTAEENTEPRFDLKQFATFLEQASNLDADLQKQILR